MTRSIALSIILAISFGSASGFALGKEESKSTANYEKALGQIKSGDLKVDFKALRLNCASSKYRCEADTEDKKKIKALLDDNNYKEALKYAQKAIEDAFVDIDLHYLAFTANMELKQEEQAGFHKTIIRELLNSIQENKHGLSENDAFVVINVHEEYVFLGFSKMKIKKQSLVNKGGHSYDVMECTDPENNRDISVYFNVDISMNQLKKAIGK